MTVNCEESEMGAIDILTLQTLIELHRISTFSEYNASVKKSRSKREVYTEEEGEFTHIYIQNIPISQSERTITSIELHK